MYLKNVELQGFKSFATKVSFELSDGITGFVGPNGCGKSNIVDAIKWGLGEQRVSTLRGDSMQDVIFNGSRTRPPMNFAEVSLFFSNTCGTLQVDYDEVVVTRRLYRSGESEYLLNRTPCRLKDIRNLFLDTGIGVNAYSMMEQGRIDSILRVDPVSRRMLFEEAAGISRYKARRKEAERKLERTQANLLRVGDIIDELERQIRSLKNQAGRARSYLKHSDRLKALKQDFFLHCYKALKEEGLAIQERKGEATGTVDRLQKELERAKEELSILESSLELQTETLAEKRTNLAEVKTALEETQSKTGYFEKRVGELHTDSTDNDEREKELASTRVEKEKNLGEIVSKLETLASEEQQVIEEECRTAEDLAGVEEEWQKAKSALERLETSALEHTRMEVDLKNKAVEAETRYHSTRTGLLRLSQRQGALTRDLANVLAEIRHMESDLAEMEIVRSKMASELEHSQERVSKMEEEVRVLDRKLQETESAIIKKESRIDVLQNMIERREGVGGGVKHLLEKAGGESSHLSFIKGMLGELLEIDMDHSTALEAALGDTAEAVVVDDTDQLKLVMEYINAGGQGRVTILPLSGFDGLSIENAPPDHALAEKVVCHNPSLRKAVDALLGDVRLIRQEDLASEGAPFHGKRVTLKGDLVDRYGILSVGGKSRDPGVISRRSELKVLLKEREDLEAELALHRGRRSKAADALEDVAMENKDLAVRLNQMGERIGLRSSDRERHVERWLHMRREFDLNAADACELERSSQSLKGELGDLDLELNRIQGELEALEDAVRIAGEEVERRRSGREQLIDTRRDLEFKKIQFRERREGIEKERCIVEENREEVRRRQEELEQTRKRLGAMLLDMEERLGEVKQRYDDLLATRSELSSTATEMATRLEVEREAHGSRKAALSREEEAVEGARRIVEDLRVDERENEVKLEALVDKAGEELRLDLEDESAAVAAESDPEQDFAAIEAEIEELRERLSRMGNVNLEAIHELEEVEARFTSLMEQREDLRKSIKSLEDLITSLNKESRQKFVETFEAVRKHFNDIFRKLFQGGRADLKLREGEDVLEAGVEIIAGPPGKEVRSINLLSGGEKTLTAVGLLFALFKSRPSPFCILDEVDAALDEVNIERFCNLLGEYAHDSQFMIITHSKRTMSYCNFLYGITMQESGVSMRISLNLEAYEDRVA